MAFAKTAAITIVLFIIGVLFYLSRQWVAFLAPWILGFIFATFILGGVFLAVLFLALQREKFLTVRANRKAAERDSSFASITVGNMGFIRETDEKAIWKAAHLQQSVYANGKYEPPSELEKRAWELFNRPTRANSKQVLSLPAGDEIEQVRTYYDLLNIYPHIMLIGGTGAGKTTQMNHAIKYRLKQYPNADIGWLSTHAALDQAENNIHPKAAIVQKMDQIVIALEDIFRAYEYRRDYPGDYDPMIIIMDDWPDVVYKCKAAGDFIVQIAGFARKTGIYLILASQGANVDSLGIKGHQDVKDNFAEVHLYKSLTMQGKAIWQQFDKKSSRIEIALPKGAFTGSGQIITLESRLPLEEQEILKHYNAGYKSATAICQVMHGGEKNGRWVADIKEVLKKHGKV